METPRTHTLNEHKSQTKNIPVYIRIYFTYYKQRIHIRLN